MASAVPRTTPHKPKNGVRRRVKTMLRINDLNGDLGDGSGASVAQGNREGDASAQVHAVGESEEDHHSDRAFGNFPEPAGEQHGSAHAGEQQQGQ